MNEHIETLVCKDLLGLFMRSEFSMQELLEGTPVQSGPGARQLMSQSAPRNSHEFEALYEQVRLDFMLPLGMRYLEKSLKTYPEVKLSPVAHQRYAEFIDYLVKLNHPARFDVLIPDKACIGSEEFKGIPSERSFYTCGYQDALTVRTPSGMNHTNSYVFRGSHFEDCTAPKILVRTGNGRVGIEPVVRAIDSEEEIANYIGFQTHALAPEIVDKIDQRLKLTESYNRIKSMNDRMNRKETMFG